MEWLGHLGECFGRCCLEVEWSWCIRGAKLRHVGSKMATKSAKMRQQRRKRAPRLLQGGAIHAVTEGWGPLRNRIPQLTN